MREVGMKNIIFDMDFKLSLLLMDWSMHTLTML